MAKTVFITGVAGFLGSHLADEYISQGWHVVGVDNLCTGHRRNIQHLSKNERFHFINQDINLPLDLDRKVDLILNFACPASPPKYQQLSLETIKSNTIGVTNILEIAKKYSATLLQASTSEIYGDPLVHPQPETYLGNVNTLGKRACYDVSKRMAETLCYEYRNKYDMDVRLIRIFNTYGPRMCVFDGRVVSNFIVQALRDENITIYGDGGQTRSFCFVSDLVKGIVDAALHSRSDDIFPLNLGIDEEHTVTQLAEMIIELSNSSSKISYLGIPEDDPKMRRPSLDQARNILGYESKVQLKEGLSYTIDYFSRMLGNKSFMLAG